MKGQGLGRVKPFALILVAAGAGWTAGADYEQAHKLYNSTDFQQSIKVLLAIPSKDAAVYALLGRNYYMEGEFKKASEALEKSFELEPTNAEYALWLGRAFGRRAEMASPFTAPGYASKTRQYFEKAVSLNPANLEAQSDLFEYYLEAPGFLGGGMEKAEATAKQVGRISPPEGLAMEAKLAERRKEYSSAEETHRYEDRTACSTQRSRVQLGERNRGEHQHQNGKGALGPTARHGHDSHRTSVVEHSGQPSGGLLRYAHAAQSGGQPARAGTEPDHHPAMGRVADRTDRKGDPDQRSGPEPGQRRQDHPAADTAADGRTAQGTGEEVARSGGAPPGGGAQHPPRRQRSGEEVGQGQEDHGRRRQEGARGNPEGDGRVHGQDRRGLQEQGKGYPGDSLDGKLTSPRAAALQ